MPAKTLPTFLLTEVQSHHTAKSCWVRRGTKVYDVTEFVEDHPGGGDLILDYAGQDVVEIMDDEISHFHTESAYEIIDDYHIGFVATEKVIDTATKSNHPDGVVPLPPTAEGLKELKANGAINGVTNGQPTRPVFESTGMSSAEDLEKETDFQADYKTHKFIDLSRPMFPQVWYGGFSKEFYLQQIHRPRHYKGGNSAPLFGNFLEPLSKTAWWVVPMVWLPPVAYGTYLASQGLPSVLSLASYWALGLGLWTIVEYGLHRCLFHVDNYLPDNRVALTAHFLLHGIHHYLPMDKYRLVMPPTLFIALATPFYKLAHFVFSYSWYAATAVFCGGIFGYICYDLTHYFLHHRNLPLHYRELKKYHLQHHFADYENGFGVTSRFWDRVFKTELQMPPPKVVKTS